MNLEPVIIKMAIVFAIVCGGLGALVFWKADPLNLRAPKNQELLKLFNNHREAFERLRMMVIKDQKRVSYVSESDTEGKISRLRKQEYETLISQIYSEMSVGVAGYHNEVRFIFASGGLSAIGSGWCKGIEYVPGDYRKAGEIVQNLDRPNKLKSGKVYLRQIEPHWFIFFQRIND